MQITVDVPDNIAQRLDQPGDKLSQHLLELIVADAYRSGKISTAEVRQALRLADRLETHAFLRKMGVYLNYDEAELRKDLQTLKEFREG